MSLDRAVAFTESFKETEGQPIVLRWANALKRYAETAPIAIFDDELIVGRPCTWLGKWGMVYPELDGAVMIAGMEMFRKNKGKSGEVIVTEEDEKILRGTWFPIGPAKTIPPASARRCRKRRDSSSTGLTAKTRSCGRWP